MAIIHLMKCHHDYTDKVQILGKRAFCKSDKFPRSENTTILMARN